MPSPAAVLDRGGRIVACNRPWRDGVGPLHGGAVVEGVDFAAVCRTLGVGVGVEIAEIVAGAPRRLSIDVPGSQADVDAWSRLTVSGYTELSGEPRTLVVCEDITGRRQVDAELRDRNRSYRALLANISGMAYRCRNDAAWTMDLVSEGCLALTGYTVEELRDNRRIAFGDLILAEDAEPLWAKCQRNLDLHLRCSNEYRIRTATGEVKWVWDQAEGGYDADGRLLAIEGLVTDISDRRQAQAALRQSEERFELAMRATRDAVWEWNCVTGETYWSQSAFALMWHEPGQVTPSFARWLERVHPDDLPALQADTERLFAGDQLTWESEYRIVGPDGVTRHVLDRRLVVRDDGGRPLRLIGAFVDVSERKLLEDQLGQARKMESIGRLAGGIAHDFNNLLSGVTIAGTLLEESIAIDDPRHEDIALILGATERATALTRQLLAFARRQITRPRLISVSDLVGQLRKLLATVAGERVTLTTTLAPDLWPALVDPGQLEQVILNLVLNGRDAMPDGGTLSVATSNVTVDPGQRARHPQLGAGDFVLLTVTDTGVGMDAHALAHAFEPFFTTKPSSRGTGLGLATCHGIIEQAGGTIEVRSALCRGTMFEVYLPRAHGQVERLVARAVQEVPDGTETILLVEDDADVRRLATRVLRTRGYTVRLARSAEEALALDEAVLHEVDLLVTDVVLPGRNGRVLAGVLRKRHPRLHVLYVSGDSQDGALLQELLASLAGFLPKPFTPAALARAVRDMLDPPPSPRRPVAR